MNELSKFQESPDRERVERLESLAYICLSVGNQAREEADAILSKYGLIAFEIKHLAKDFTARFDRYNAAVRPLYRKEMGMVLCEDYEGVRSALYRYAGLEEKEPTECSAANNDQIEFGHIADNDKC